MRVEFTKMHALGNDFVVLDDRSGEISRQLRSEQVAGLADRHRGIGFDQLLIARAGTNAALAMKILNADGSVAEQCGNGLRCFARFAQRLGLAGGGKVEAQTDGGLVEMDLHGDESVSARLYAPDFEPGAISLALDDPRLSRVDSQSYVLAHPSAGEIAFGAVSMGNPHAVLLVPSVNCAPVDSIGSVLQCDPVFPAGVNVGFAEIIAPGNIRLRVNERGVGETQACGSGACAAMVYGRRAGKLDACVQVDLPGGSLEVSWQGGAEDPVWLRGEAVFSFDGSVEI